MIDCRKMLILLCFYSFSHLVMAEKEKPISVEAKILNAAAALAISKDDVSLLGTLQKSGWRPCELMFNDVNYPPPEQKNPLHWAVFNNSPKSVAWLLVHGSDIFTHDEDGLYPIQHLAATPDANSKKIIEIIRKTLVNNPQPAHNSPTAVFAGLVKKNIFAKQDKLVFINYSSNVRNKPILPLIKKLGVKYDSVEVAEKGEWDEGDYRHRKSKQFGSMLNIVLTKKSAVQYTFKIEVLRNSFSGRVITGEIVSFHGFWITRNTSLLET